MKHRRSTLRPIVIGALISCSLLAVGCAHSVVVAPKTPERAGDKLPMDVALYLTDEFKGYKVSQFKMGDKWNYDNLGQASANQFTLGLGKVFRTVEVVGT